MKEEKPIPQAVALEYDGLHAPKVTAKGSEELALEIIALAKEHGIPLYENPELVQLLSRIDLGEEIPQQLYVVIARVIAFAYALVGKTPDKNKKKLF
jgi:flagellar biosynthesis protein